MIYAVGNNLSSLQSFGAYRGNGSRAKRGARKAMSAIEDLGKQVNMNRYKQINKAKIEQKQLGTQPVFFNPYTPMGNVKKVK